MSTTDESNQEYLEQMEDVARAIEETLKEQTKPSIATKGESDRTDIKQARTRKENKDTSNVDAKDSEKEAELKAHPFDVRVAVVGNVDSGKSTLIGVLTGGVLDDGRGLARSKIFVHRHEGSSGRTSCISQHIMGFDKDRKVVHQPVAASAGAAQKTKSWREVVNQSASICTFIDLAGHEKYLKTTIAGLTGCFPDHAMVLINSLAGVTKMTREHLGVVLALRIPLCCVVTKIDMCPPNVLRRTKKQLFKILRSPQAQKRLPLTVRTEKDIAAAIKDKSHRVTPVFWVSCVSGQNLPLLLDFLSRLEPDKAWKLKADAPLEFNIDETFSVTGVGIVLSGTVSSGTLRPGSTLLLGPYPDGSFQAVFIRTIHCKRVPVDSCQSGDSCAVSLRSVRRKKPLKRSDIRRGMVLVDTDSAPVSTRNFEAEVLVLHHPTTIKLHYQAVIHCGIIRQTAAITAISKECLRTGDKARVRFRFMIRPEVIHNKTRFIFREGNTKGIGWIRKVLPSLDAAEENGVFDEDDVQDSKDELGFSLSSTTKANVKSKKTKAKKSKLKKSKVKPNKRKESSKDKTT